MHDDLQIVLGIPGEWPTQADIVAAIVKQGRFLFGGNIITDLRTQLSYSLDIHEHDEHLADVMAFAGQHSLRPADVERIRRHTFVLYVIGPGGLVPAARDITVVADSLLQAGGLGVKVETAGAAHSAEYWHHLTEHRSHDAALFDAFVTFVERDGAFFSCGMHNLGLPDALVQGEPDPELAGELLQTFLLYTLLEQPDLKDGHTFRAEAQGRPYRLRYGPCETFKTDELMYNPFGMWSLTPA